MGALMSARRHNETWPARVRVGGNLFRPETPAGAVYIGRQGPRLSRSPFANPFRAGNRAPAAYGGDLVVNVDDAIDRYWRYVDGRPDLVALAYSVLLGHDLACWCPVGTPCHGDGWLERLYGNH